MKRNLSPYTGCEERQLILLIRSDRSLYGAFCFGMRKSFILYIDSFEVLQHLSDDQLGKLTRLLFKYQIDGSTPEVTDPLFIPFGFIRSSMDRDNEKWEQRADRARTNGTKGGRPKENQEGYQETQETQSVILKPKEPVSVSVSVSGSVNASVSENVNESVSYRLPDSKESNPVTIQPDSIQLYTTTLEKKKVPQKKKDHRFADSIYADDPDLFIEHWNQTETARTHPDTDPLKVYTTLKTSSDASSKYTYANWISAAQNWVKRNPAEYKRTYTTATGHQLHHNDQAILDRVERLTRNTFGG
jgi:hypothetical protein